MLSLTCLKSWKGYPPAHSWSGQPTYWCHLLLSSAHCRWKSRCQESYRWTCLLLPHSCRQCLSPRHQIVGCHNLLEGFVVLHKMLLEAWCCRWLCLLPLYHLNPESPSVQCPYHLPAVLLVLVGLALQEVLGVQAFPGVLVCLVGHSHCR